MTDIPKRLQIEANERIEREIREAKEADETFLREYLATMANHTARAYWNLGLITDEEYDSAKLRTRDLIVPPKNA